VPLGPYFGDFVCREQKLVIELDGATHERMPKSNGTKDAALI